MRRLRMKSWFASTTLLFTCFAATSAVAKVVVNFTGRVEEVSDLGVSPPAGVGVGDPVSGTVTYVHSAAVGREEQPLVKSYTFAAAENHVLQVTIGSKTWTTSLGGVSVCDGPCGGDNMQFGGITNTPFGFPGMVNSGAIVLMYGDSVEPYELISGTDLPKSAEDIRFDQANLKDGTISSISENMGWVIKFTMGSSTLPVHAKTWSQVKQLYAEPGAR